MPNNTKISVSHSLRYLYQKQRITSIVGVCLVFLFALSACSLPGNSSTPANTTATPTTVPTPTISSSLSEQGNAQLQTFQQWISLMKQYNGDTTTYQQQYDTDSQQLQQAKTNASYSSAVSTVKTQIAAIQMPAMKAETAYLQKQLQQESAAWGKQHVYHDSYNNTNYPLGYEYGVNGMGGWVQDELQSASTLADYQQAVEDINMYLTNFKAMTTNTSDKTPYNQVHQSDLQLIQHYGKTGRVVVISLEEQAMRVYDNGKLVKAFLVTTGRPNKPSLPGVWWVEGKLSPTVFKSGVPTTSPDYYPPTPINYAMQYHSQGYFIHDSWWRVNYGPGTNYPHADDSGDPFSSQGSHGCINMSKADAGWLYPYVKVYTPIIVY